MLTQAVLPPELGQRAKTSHRIEALNFRSHYDEAKMSQRGMYENRGKENENGGESCCRLYVGKHEKS